MSSLDDMARRVAGVTSRPRTAGFRVFALLAGAALFLVIVPVLLLWAGVSVTAAAGWTAGTGRALRLAAGCGAAGAGLALLVWAMLAFWFRGFGTPAPFAAPQRLVTGGPFRHTRNPIMLGAVIYFFGVGSLAASLPAGAGMAGVALALGSLYHRFIEEKELRLRFGAEYEAYRRRTPFLLPRLRPRRGPS